MPIRHASIGHLTPRGITPRRLSAAKRALQRQRERLPLFADQVAAEQGTPEERIEYFDQKQLERDQGHRDLAARHWRWGRHQLSQLSAEIRLEIIERWFESPMIRRMYASECISGNFANRDGLRTTTCAPA